MRALETLKRILREPREPYDPELVEFQRLDLARIKDEYRLEEVGAEQGRAGAPPPESLSYDATESGIRTRFETERLRWGNEFLRHLTTFHQRLAALGLQTRFADVQNAAREAIGEFEADLAKSLDELTLARGEVRDVHRAMEDFKRRNGLIRPADEPESKLWHVGVVVVLVLVETILNGFFLAKGDEGGLLGGAGQALFIALLNVGAALAFGRFVVPEVAHMSRARRAIGGLLFVGYLFSVAILNLGVGHYREALIAGVEAPGQAAVSSFLTNPLAVADFTSWIMVGIGLLFAFVALVDGYNMGDRYPGYGRITRQQRRIFEEYSDRRAAAIDKLRAIRDEAVATIQDVRNDLAKRRREHDAILMNRTRFINQWNAHLAYLEEAANELVAIYRTANRQARGDIPVPAYFEERFRFLPNNDQIPTPPSLSPEALEAALKTTDKALEGAIAALFEAFDRNVPRFKPIDVLTAEEVV